MSLSQVLLVLLSKQPNSGYGLGRQLRCEVAHVWEARLQQIYSELAKLEADGLVTSVSEPLPNRPAKKSYSLTDAGYDALDRWLEQPPVHAAARHELLARLICLERLPQALLIKRLEEHREQHAEQVRSLREQLNGHRALGADALGQTLTLEFALAQAEAQVSWAERALSLLSADREESPIAARRAAAS